MAKPPTKQKRSKREKEIRFLILRTVANFLILITIAGALGIFGPAAYFEAEFRLANAFGVKNKIIEESATQPSELGKLLERTREEQGGQGESLLSTIISGDKERIVIPKSAEFSVVIPKIGANENVIANVDPSNKKEYLEALTRGVAHAKGTTFPGRGGTTYLFAHSADVFWNVGRYNAVFYLIKELEQGDDIFVFFNGQRFNYKVTDSQIVDPSEVSFVRSNPEGGERLILQACWPPGTTLKRLLVFAEPV